MDRQKVFRDWLDAKIKETEDNMNSISPDNADFWKLFEVRKALHETRHKFDGLFRY